MKLKIANLLFLSLLVSACGVVPKAFQGDFTAKESGATLQLTAAKGVLQLQNGRTIEAKAQALDFKKLAKSETGIYLAQSKVNSKLMEVYWIQPLEPLKKETPDFGWFRGEVFFSFFDQSDLQKKELANQITLFHCAEGQILLDFKNKSWQVGCPPAPEVLIFQRNPK